MWGGNDASSVLYLSNHWILERRLKDCTLTRSPIISSLSLSLSVVPQLFDFGLARELKARDLQVPPDGYDATGLTGSRRYMAPEVVRCEYYGFSADVFSFSILFWELIALKTPFVDYDASKHFDLVVRKNRRPSRLPELPSQVQAMMADAWNPEPLRRPKMNQICQILLVAITDRMGMSADVVSDRSTFLLDRSIQSMYREDESP